MPETQFERKFSILKQERDHCETAIGRYDTIVFGIRGWAVTVFAGVLGASVSLRHPSLIFLAIAPTLLFWIVEVLNKSFQALFIKRVRQIEAHLRSKEFETDIQEAKSFHFVTPQISEDFYCLNNSGARRRIIGILRCFFYANVSVVYGSILTMCLACWAYFRVVPHH